MDWEIGAEYETVNGLTEILIGFSAAGFPVFERQRNVGVAGVPCVSTRTIDGRFVSGNSGLALDIVRKKPKVIRLTGYMVDGWVFGENTSMPDTHYIDINVEDIKPLEGKDDRRSP